MCVISVTKNCIGVQELSVTHGAARKYTVFSLKVPLRACLLSFINIKDSIFGQQVDYENLSKETRYIKT